MGEGDPTSEGAAPVDAGSDDSAPAGPGCLSRITRGTLRTILWIVFAVALVAFGLLKTSMGNAALLEFGLDRVRERVAGQIEVGEIRSGNLLQGALLKDVRLTTLEGDTLIVADSVEASYSLPDLIRGRVGLRGVRIWGGQLHLEGGGPDRLGTLARWTGAAPPTDTARTGETAPAAPDGGGGFDLTLTDVRVEDFAVRIRQPTELPMDGLVRVDTAATGERRMAVDLLIEVARFPRVAIRPGSDELLAATVARFEAQVDVLRQSVFVNALRGQVRVTDDLVVADLADLRSDGLTASGALTVGLADTASVLLQMGLDIEEFDTEPYQWISAGIPELSGSMGLDGIVRTGGSRWTATEAELDLASGDVAGRATLALGDGPPRLEDVDLRFDGVRPGELEAWLPPSARIGGSVAGTLRASGSLNALSLSTRTTWTTPDARRLTTEIEGGLTGLQGGGAGGIGFESLTVRVDSLDWAAVREVAPSSPLEGTGSLEGTLTGTLQEGVEFTGEVRHDPASGGDVSRVVATGVVSESDDVVRIAVSGELSPVSFTSLAEGWEELPVRGSVFGTFEARGPISALQVTAALRAASGRAELQGTFDARNPAAGFRLSGTVDSIQAARLLPALGEPTVISGSLDVEGAGSDVATLRGSGRVRLGASEIGGMPIDSMVLAARIADGRMVIDTLHGRAGGFDLRALGTLALADSLPSGTIRAEFSTESLMGLRPFFMGDSVLARPEEGLERRALEAEGIDPDTLPSREEVTWGGSARGEVTLRGSLESFELEGSGTAADLKMGHNTVQSIRFEATGTEFPGSEARLDLRVSGDSLSIFDREYTFARVEGDVGWDRGRLQVDLERGQTEDYRAVGGFRLDSLGGRVDVDTLTARFDSISYRLERPTALAWTDSAVTVDSLEIVQDGPDPMRILASGTLPRFGEADFLLDVRGLRIDRLTRVIQRSDIDAAGRVDLQARITGRARAPIITGSLRVDSLRTGEFRVERLEGTVDYRDRVAGVDLGAWRSGSRVLDARGTVPIDLSFVPGTDRFVDEAMDLEIVASELPAASALAIIEDLEQVEGTVSGRFAVSGTLEDPTTSGTLNLSGGAWTIGSLGVRHTEVRAEASLDENNVVSLTARGRSGGEVRVDGTVTLAPLDDPRLDLSFTLDEFLAVDRRDVVGVVSGQASLTDSYRSPDVTGSLTVDEGTIYLDEFVRNASVIDLTDPRYQGLLGDLALEEGNQLLDIAGNPFMNALRVNMTLDVEGETWLRGRELSVEIGGELDIFYDRSARDFVFQGDLEARRGQYSNWGRTFQVESGTVEFIGTPGLNPGLNIIATTRVRRPEASDLVVEATLTGTLVEPRLRLSAADSEISESDVISYLVLGRPSSEITSSLTGSSNQAIGTVAGTGATFLTGTIASRLGALAAQNTDFIDYLSITGLGEATAGAGSPYSLAGTQVELGRYFADGDLFGAVVLRAAQLGSQPIGGARLEWQSSDQFHVEAFFEDRFLRVASLGLAELGSGSAYVFGFALVREWGY